MTLFISIVAMTHCCEFIPVAEDRDDTIVGLLWLICRHNKTHPVYANWFALI